MEDIYSQRVRSGLASIAWPGIPTRVGSVLMAMQFQFEQSQWLSEETLLSRQRRQLKCLLDHALLTVPHYRKKFAGLGMESCHELTMERWRQLPILSREEVQTVGQGLHSTNVPPAHGKITSVSTSGSTGRPIVAHRTEAAMLFWQAFTLRDHYWHRRKLSAKLAAIRPEGRLEPGKTVAQANWGPPTAQLFETGPAVMLSVRTDIETQVNWLLEQKPVYLLSLPTNLLELARYFEREALWLDSLREVRTYGEIVTPEVRQAIHSAWGAELKDVYSAQEVGYIALQCPENDNYHVQSEGLLLEVLDDRDNPCDPGQVGRVVVTPLHNFAMPLIRYELGDYAEVGEPCECGRGLPVLTRVLGRQRNMLTMPDGRKCWPSFTAGDWMDIAPIRQVQLVQTAPNSITINLVSERALNEVEQKMFFKALGDRFGYPFDFTLNYLDEIGRSSCGKYEDFVSRIRAF